MQVEFSCSLEILELNILFIFDNAKDADNISELIINLPNNVRTIITIKNNNLKDNFKFGNESNLEMKPLTRSECIEYIQNVDKKRKFNQFQAEKLIDLIKTNEKEVYSFKLSKHCIYLDENFISIDILKEILTEEKSNNEIDIDKEKQALEDLSLKTKLLEKLVKAVDNKMSEIHDMPNGDWTKAEIYYRHAYKLINMNLPQEIQDNENLATLYLKIAKYDENIIYNFDNLIKYYENNSKIIKTLYDGSHPDVARSLNNVGSTYHKLGDAQKGLQYRVEALEMFRDLYKGSH
ncbi:unnamed protein product [Didymodactylos carnosus]|uniref:Uncharacterized protein n=1 Tax=Didymodactylos carnosus TaxID=1234261 RepID=A0A815PL06_9BILA|nr:unnamed protein product [Didymodactylos carnosus]CAF1450708.1 unnamed protein product [Didymodactylos carnosus]CAF4232810.1 unnamed protein product [Didymodactylos carnosus]CAF4324189.1 unnamed protein product [Didymodactylos carnosus]